MIKSKPCSLSPLGLLGVVEVTFEDLAIVRRLAREPNEVGAEDCMSTGIAYVCCWVMAGILGRCKRKVAQFHRAEKDDERMALKICTGAKILLKALIKRGKMCKI
jgi:hypothetical protein